MKTELTQELMALLRDLTFIAGFPDLYLKGNRQDTEAAELLLEHLYMPCSSQERVQVYVGLSRIYDDEETVPEYVEKLGHILTCRYAPLSDEALLKADHNIRQLTASLAALISRTPERSVILSKGELDAVPQSYEMHETLQEDGGYMYRLLETVKRKKSKRLKKGYMDVKLLSLLIILLFMLGCFIGVAILMRRMLF